MPDLQTDPELLQALARGEQPALRTLYDRHADRVYNLALTYVQDPALAQEVTQDTFTKVWRSAGKFRGDSQVTTWLYRIAVNTALSAARKQQRRRVFGLFAEAPEVPDFAHPNALLESREENRALMACIYQLPERQKMAFLLSYVEELPRQQVADVMNLSLKAVESLLIRAKRTLRVTLKTTHPHRGRKK